MAEIGNVDAIEIVCKIQNADSDTFLTVKDGVVCGWGNMGIKSQVWILKQPVKGVNEWTLFNKGAKKVLTGPEAKKPVGLEAPSKPASKSMLWTRNKDEGIERLESNLHDDYVVDLQGSRRDDGTPVYCWEGTGSGSQKWYIKEVRSDEGDEEDKE